MRCTDVTVVVPLWCMLCTSSAVTLVEALLFIAQPRSRMGILTRHRNCKSSWGPCHAFERLSHRLFRWLTGRQCGLPAKLLRCWLRIAFGGLLCSTRQGYPVVRGAALEPNSRDPRAALVPLWEAVPVALHLNCSLFPVGRDSKVPRCPMIRGLPLPVPGTATVWSVSGSSAEVRR